MVDRIEVLWTPAGHSLPSLGARALVDVTDGDTPNIRMPVRMLSVDTPEVTASSPAGAARVDERFAELVGWLNDGTAPVSARFRDYILPKLATGTAGTLQFSQGKAASAFFAERKDARLTRPNGTLRSLFLRAADEFFDDNGRLLAYIAPSFSSAELRQLSRAERATFNLDLVESGWAAPFIIFPSLPGELDMPLFVAAAVDAMENGRGQYAEPLSLPGYEYRMCEKLHRISRRIAEGAELSFPEKLEWRSRYCVDMRERTLHGPEEYMDVPPPYRIWIWPDDVQRAVSMLNLVPSMALTA
jgi:endonuclease YncB( thermonuclease family)